MGDTRGTAGKKMLKHQRMIEKRDLKRHIYKYFFETRGHRFYVDAVKIVATEKLESSRRFMEEVHTKITNQQSIKCI